MLQCATHQSNTCNCTKSNALNLHKVNNKGNESPQECHRIFFIFNSEDINANKLAMPFYN